MSSVDLIRAALRASVIELSTAFWNGSRDDIEARCAEVAESIIYRVYSGELRDFKERHRGVVEEYEVVRQQLVHRPGQRPTNGAALRWTGGAGMWPAIETRNLIYHVCPLEKNDIWRANLRQLRARWGAFNGTKTLAIGFGERLLPAQCVHSELEGLDYTFFECPNDPVLREVISFLPLLASVASQDQKTATFYAHTKGNSTGGDIRGSELWRNMMYHELLDEWPRAMEELKTHAAVGTTKIVWRQGQRPPYPTKLVHGHWMLAGTFFWFRHDRVFMHPRWRDVPTDRYGAEAWLSGMFEPSEAKSVFQPWSEDKYPTPSPYDPKIYTEPITDDMLVPGEVSA